MAFHDAVLTPLQEASGNRNLRAPTQATWGWDEARRRIELTVSTAILSGKMYDPGPASPAYALAFAAALQRIQGAPVAVQVTVEGPLPAVRSSPWLHLQRSLLLLSTYAERVPGYTVDGPAWTWPDDPVFNAESDRSKRTAPVRGEPLLEHHLATSVQARAAFSARVEPIGGFGVQLPVGLFSGAVTGARGWTVRRKAAVDLWAEGAGAVHLFELKAPGNNALGILPEALCYLRLLDAVRTGVARAAPGAIGAAAVARAARLAMWLSAEDLHPLVWHPAWGSPAIEVLNAGLSGCGLGLLPLAGGIDAPRFAFDDPRYQPPPSSTKETSTATSA